MDTCKAMMPSLQPSIPALHVSALLSVLLTASTAALSSTAAGSLVGACATSDDDVTAASWGKCVEYGDLDDPSIYYKNCSGTILNAQCDKGQTWNAGVGCVDTLGSTAGNAYEGYKRE
jgi:hypothetical protein